MLLEWLRTYLESRPPAPAATPCAAVELDLAPSARELAAELHDYPCPAN